MPARFFALIPAAGSGSRAGAGRPKQYLALNGEPMLIHTLRAFVACASIESVRVVLAPDDIWPACAVAQAFAAEAGAKLCFDRVGGATRAASVANGLKAIRDHADANDWVLVHDAARPCITAAMVEGLIRALEHDSVGGLLALPVADTVKRADLAGRVTATVPREGLWLAQTPQMFRFGLLSDAYAAGGEFTDEAAAVEALGAAPRLIVGSANNFKVTYPQDIARAELVLGRAQDASGS